MSYENTCPQKDHVHELQGSITITERNCDPHNHRFAVTTGEAIPTGAHDHVHEVKFRTDTYEGHEHIFCGRTLGAVAVGDRHVHFLAGCTETADGHRHEFRAATLINDPIGD